MHQIKGIVFDLDGTLVDTIADLTASVNVALSALGRESIPAPTVRTLVGDGVKVLISRAVAGNNDLVPEGFRLFAEDYRQQNGLESTLFEGVEEILTHYRDKRLAILTNKPQQYVGKLLDRVGIAHHFDIIQGAREDVPLKPAPDALLNILARLELQGDEAVMVGDSDHDLLAGRAAGMLTAAVTYGYRPRHVLTACHPDAIVNRIVDLRYHFA